MFTSADIYADHLADPRGENHVPADAHTGRAGGASCGNTLAFHVQVVGDRVADAGFEATGCQALTAAASMAVETITGQSVFDAATLSAGQVIEEIGLTTAKQHVAPLVEDAVAVALGRACYQSATVAADPQRTLIAMSGGVDSSVVAWMAQRDGLRTIAVTLELWRDADNDSERSCCSASAVRAARAQAHRLGIPHFTLDLRTEFAEGVVSPYLQAHRDAQTPNPCVACNGDVRLDAMIDLADRLGAADLRTGHYARTADDGAGSLLRAASDPAKDQTYMLARLKAGSLARMRFPLGELTKPQVREIAAQAGLFAAERPDSQDLCFLAGTDRATFLARHGAIADRPGDIVTRDGRVLGRHQGVHLFTIGQRKGLGVAGGSGEPLYVIELRARDRQVVVGSKDELAAVSLPLRAVRLHRPSSRVTHVRLRYHAQPVAVSLPDMGEGTHSRAVAQLAEPAEAIVPGQSAQLLDGDLVVGQATIGVGVGVGVAA
jgi:tRNA-specific 2-thiouridylase